MTHKNKPATDYEFRLGWVSSGIVTGSFDTGGMNETWGNPYSSFIHGIGCTATNNLHTGQYKVDVVTPWGSWTSGWVTGAISTANFRCAAHNWALTVNTDCTWSLAFDALVIYLTLNSGTETAVVTIGATAQTGTSYDERLNITHLQTSLGIAIPSAATCTSTSSSSSSASIYTGGYRYKNALGAWVYDAVALDNSSPSGGSCTCTAVLPTLTATSVYDVSGSSGFSFVIVRSANRMVDGCSPPWPSPTHFTVWDINSDFKTWSSNVSIKDRTTLVGDQNIASGWDCILTPGGSTSGSSSTTTTPAFTTCASGRGVMNSTHQILNCYTPHEPPGCVLPFVPSDNSCQYDGSAVLTWPTLPPCTPSILNSLGYDVSRSLRHVRVYGDATTHALTMGCAGNTLPQTWTDLVTTLTATWARPRFQDQGSTWPIGLFYGDGTNCYFAQSYDCGATWGSPISMASGTIGDFEEGANGLRWFYKVLSSDGGATFDVWHQLRDARLNVLRAWTITNVTGVDNEPIAVRESPNANGSWKIGLFCSRGGSPSILFSSDGLNFS
jgi:hypothetical protein